ncbi:hypothetical protein Ae706Ps2_2352c [Pseudonocardia sp. Ae706_Ps2]|nr:hypothetical protein Ae706Ps2_2352c [Pseudonocardia sp. Ae706_Ps2]
MVRGGGMVRVALHGRSGSSPVGPPRRIPRERFAIVAPLGG